jgi:hypothetical protein
MEVSDPMAVSFRLQPPAIATMKNQGLGGLNLFIVDADGVVRTPALTGTLLEGGMRAAILQLLVDENRPVREDRIVLSECSTRSGAARSPRCSPVAPPQSLPQSASWRGRTWTSGLATARPASGPGSCTAGSPIFTTASGRTRTIGCTAWSDCHAGTARSDVKRMVSFGVDEGEVLGQDRGAAVPPAGTCRT